MTDGYDEGYEDGHLHGMHAGLALGHQKGREAALAERGIHEYTGRATKVIRYKPETSEARALGALGTAGVAGMSQGELSESMGRPRLVREAVMDSLIARGLVIRLFDQSSLRWFHADVLADPAFLRKIEDWKVM